MPVYNIVFIDIIGLHLKSLCPQGSTSGVVLVGGCLLVSSSGRTGQLTLHDYWAAVAEDKDHTDSW